MKQQISTQKDFPAEEELWQALLARDPGYSGRAFYAVRSTGIYCRLDCPSRRPRRDQVTFFATCQEAEQAGFRACKRCRPEQAAAPLVARVEQACRILENEGYLPLEKLASRLGASPYHVQRTFKAVTGLTPYQFAARLRSSQLKAQLREGHSVTEALYEAGYGSSSRLYESTAQNLGMTPGQYRQGGKNMNIHYTIVDAPLVGRLLVAGTDQGVCSVTFGDDDQALVAGLAAEYPLAKLALDGENLAAWVRAILAHLSGLQPHLDLPLDLRATAFQLKVWEELRRIPYGETRTYTQVAQAIGKPAAVRAVAHACASNPAALVTPCHRVLRADGTLGGYRWGLARKETLLKFESESK
jgi:AraC family transcriptional regulator, regulatory protein of adaptative response / methylated-DNA-[protein]-cysteine methyltransferase